METQDDRCFVDPNADGLEDFQQWTPPHMHRHHGLDHDSHNPHPLQSHFVLAESEIIGPDSSLLKTIREEAEELLGTVAIPFRNEVKSIIFSKEEKKARERLQKLGLNQYQIVKAIEMELKVKNSRKTEARTGNLVYRAASEKIRRYHQCKGR